MYREIDKCRMSTCDPTDTHRNRHQKSPPKSEKSARPHEEQSFIHTSHFKTLSQQKYFQSIIPRSRGLFQTVKCFLKFINTVWKLGIFETRGLLHITLFLNKTIQEGRFNIHLENFKTLGSSKCKKDSNSFQTSNRGKSLLKINTLFLAQPLGNKTSLVSNNQPIITLLVFENPLRSDGITGRWRLDQNPNFVS